MDDTPVKRLNFNIAGKENMPAEVDASSDIEVTKPVEEIKKAVTVAPTIKSAEMNEPLLQENPNRFVLFPIKYHEVSRVDASRTR